MLNTFGVMTQDIKSAVSRQYFSSWSTHPPRTGVGVVGGAKMIQNRRDKLSFNKNVNQIIKLLLIILF